VEEEGRVLILTSSIKLTMHMFENMCLGNSIMSLDHTFKIMKEQMEMVTLGTVDNGRHGKTLAFGPSSHTDTMAVTDACEMFASFFRILISGIRNRALPDVWSESVKQATYNAYGAMVDANPQVVECRPQRGLSDLAPAILQGMLGPGTSYPPRHARSAEDREAHRLLRAHVARHLGASQGGAR
jgi:hypothetical protein